MGIMEFLLEHHFDIFKEYERSLLKWETLQVGTKVITLRAGFCGGSGELRIVKELGSDGCGNFAKLGFLYKSPEEDRISTLYEYESYSKEHWWKCVVIIPDYDNYRSLYPNEKSRYLKNLAGKNI